MTMRVAVHTLGCKLNYAESSTVAREFARRGYEVVSHTEEADIYIVNTCSVTEHSDKKDRNLIRRLHRRSPEAIIAVIGCYAQLQGEYIASMEGVDLVLGAQDKGRVVDEVERLLASGRRGRSDAEITDIDSVHVVYPAFSTGERTRSFLKIQDGCDYKCTYCTVPYARGCSRSLPSDMLVAQAEEIAASGIKEIVLTGVNTGDYGRKTGESFLELLRRLDAVEGIYRYRISSIEPNLLKPEIVDWIASGTKFLPHFHIPLQSGCDAVLRRMGRRYDTDFFRRKIAYIRERMEHVFFGIDVIVGFPGETDIDFNATCDFLREIRPAFIHVFPYSRRSGTPAAVMPDQVADLVKTGRVDMLERMSSEFYETFCRENSGREEEVLFESKSKGGKMFGYTRNYIKVEEPFDKDLIGRIVRVTLP